MTVDRDPCVGEGEFGRWPLGLIISVQDATPFSPFHPQEWEQALARAVERGYEAVELAITNPTQVGQNSVAADLARADLRLSSITTGQAAGKEGLSLSTPNDRARHKAIERVQAHMSFASRFGAVVIVGLLRGAEGSLDLLVESLQECARCDPKVRLALEPLNRYESRLVNTVAEALEIVDLVGTENLGLLFDTFHSNIEEPDIGEAARVAGERLFHVHLADSNRWPPGHGHLDFRPVWDALRDVGYDGSLVLECFPKPGAEAVLAAGSRIRSWWT